MGTITEIDTLRTTATGTDGREACSFKWYAARTQMNCERKVEKRFQQFASETYVPTQEEVHQWSDRKKKVQRLVIPMVIFVKINSKEVARVHASRDSQFYGFISTDRAGRFPAEIPNKDIETLKFMLGVSENPVTFEQERMEAGDNVTIVRGALKGMKGNIQQLKDGNVYLIVDMGLLGLVKTIVDPSDCKKLLDEE